MNNNKVTEPGKDDSAGNETEILAPNMAVTLGNETVIVREFAMAEQFAFAVAARPLIEDLRQATFESGDGIPVDAIEATFAKHSELVCEMIAASINKPVAYVQQVRGSAADRLFMTFWSVNRDFFVQRMIAKQVNALTGEVSATSSLH